MAERNLVQLHPRTRIDLKGEPVRIEGYFYADTRVQLETTIRVLSIILDLLPDDDAGELPRDA